MLNKIRELLGLVAEDAAAKAKADARAERRREREPRTIESIDTTRDPRYAGRAARGHGVSQTWYRPRTSPRACRPIDGQPRTSVAFRQLRRAGFEVQQSGGRIFAVPVTGAAMAAVGGKPQEIGRTVA